VFPFDLGSALSGCLFATLCTCSTGYRPDFGFFKVNGGPLPMVRVLVTFLWGASLVDLAFCSTVSFFSQDLFAFASHLLWVKGPFSN